MNAEHLSNEIQEREEKESVHQEIMNVKGKKKETRGLGVEKRTRHDNNPLPHVA